MAKLESKFQHDLIEEIETTFEGSVVLKNDANYIQGFPDLTVFCGPLWALLECKRSDNEPYRPNQKYYLGLMGSVGFARMICPENKAEVLDALRLYFGGVNDGIS